jgi:hypothetical protein
MEPKIANQQRRNVILSKQTFRPKVAEKYRESFRKSNMSNFSSRNKILLAKALSQTPV